MQLIKEGYLPVLDQRIPLPSRRRTIAATIDYHQVGKVDKGFAVQTWDWASSIAFIEKKRMIFIIYI